HERGVVRVLDEEARVPDEHVRAEDGLDGVEDRGMTYEVREPREEQVRLVAELAAVRRLDRLQAPAIAARVVRREHGEREQEAVAPEARERGAGHGRTVALGSSIRAGNVIVNVLPRP